MKTAVEATWVLVAFGALIASIDALHRLGLNHNGAGILVVGLIALVWVTWHTHWKR